MSRQLRALDLFSGAGGASFGLMQAGFHVTGVDIKPQPRYVGDAFIQADALTVDLAGYDFIWASPPCQGYSEATPLHLKDAHSRLIADIRLRIFKAGALYAIENVDGALKHLFTPALLCGSQFGMRVRRHRWIETPFPVLTPPCNHRDQGTPLSVTGTGYGGKQKGHNGTKPAGIEEARKVMGIDWMTIAELSQAIPPAYSRFIGEQALRVLGRERVA